MEPTMGYGAKNLGVEDKYHELDRSRTLDLSLEPSRANRPYGFGAGRMPSLLVFCIPSICGSLETIGSRYNEGCPLRPSLRCSAALRWVRCRYRRPMVPHARFPER